MFRKEKKIDFWLEVENFKKLTTLQAIKTAAEEICGTYIHTNVIGADEQMIKDVDKEIKSGPSKTVFNKIENAIMEELQYVFFCGEKK